jgi:hypothetical protein
MATILNSRDETQGQPIEDSFSHRFLRKNVASVESGRSDGALRKKLDPSTKDPPTEAAIL